MRRSILIFFAFILISSNSNSSADMLRTYDVNLSAAEMQSLKNAIHDVEPNLSIESVNVKGYTPEKAEFATIEFKAHDTFEKNEKYKILRCNKVAEWKCRYSDEIIKVKDNSHQVKVMKLNGISDVDSIKIFNFVKAHPQILFNNEPFNVRFGGYMEISKVDDTTYKVSIEESPGIFIGLTLKMNCVNDKCQFNVEDIMQWAY